MLQPDNFQSKTHHNNSLNLFKKNSGGLHDETHRTNWCPFDRKSVASSPRWVTETTRRYCEIELSNWSLQRKWTIDRLGVAVIPIIHPKIRSCWFLVHLFSKTFSLPDGPLGPLQVDEKYTGHGLGRVVCKETLRQIASLGIDNVAVIFEWNVASRAIFEKLGFQLEPGTIRRIFSQPNETIGNSN